MAPRFTARTIELHVHLGRGGYWGSLAAVAHRDGRLTRRLLNRSLTSYTPVSADRPDEIVDVLEQVVAQLRERYPRRPSAEPPAPPEGATGGPVPQDRYQPDTPPLPGT